MRHLATFLAVSSALAGAASAAELKAPPAAPAPNPFDIAFAAGVMTDYVSRGITLSARKPSAAIFFEPRYDLTPAFQIYGGVSSELVDLPNRADVEFDVWIGARHKIERLLLDYGIVHYSYFGGETFDGRTGAASCTTGVIARCNIMKGRLGFWELYAKPSYALNDAWTVGATLFYSPSAYNSGASGLFVTGTARVVLPASLLPQGVSGALSGEIGRYFIGTTDTFYTTPAHPNGVPVPDYTTWNLGLSLSHGAYTLDLRYHDTDASKSVCNTLTSDNNAQPGGPAAVTPVNPLGLVSDRCGAAFVARLTYATLWSLHRGAYGR